jgi:hypothetical protein
MCYWLTLWNAPVGPFVSSQVLVPKSLYRFLPLQQTHASANQHAMASSPLHHRRVVVLAILAALIGVTILLPTVQAQKLRTGPLHKNKYEKNK